MVYKNIRIDAGTHARLKTLGQMGESFGDVILRLLDVGVPQPFGVVLAAWMHPVTYTMLLEVSGLCGVSPEQYLKESIPSMLNRDLAELRAGDDDL
jgi:hypothetical protein